MMKVKVIALGNVLMKDDGIGIEVAKVLERKLLELGIEVIYGETDVGYCISKVNEKDFIFILDASCYGKNPGELSIFPINQFVSVKKGYTQHSYSFIDMIRLYVPTLQGRILAIETKEITLLFGLSQELKDNLNLISKKVLDAMIDTLRKEDIQMHDTILLQKISEEVNNVSIHNKIKKIYKLTVKVNHRSHVNEENLLEHLQFTNKELIGSWTAIKVIRDDIPDQIAILESLEGDHGEE